MKNIINIANLLSFSRVILSVPLWYSLLEINKDSSASSINYFLILCLIIAITDLLDGYAARYFNSVTDLGKFLDPIADKICALVLILFLSIRFGWYYLSLLILVLIRDLIISVVSVYFARTKGKYLQANIFGKWFLFFIAMSMILSVVLTPDIIREQYIYLSTLNSIFYTLSWTFFFLATYRYFSTYYLLFKGDNV